MPHRLSVALCTFDGGAHLPPQLDSLLAQTRRPDEVVAFDDGSTDGTVAALERFATAAPFPVRVHANAEQLGPAQNFARAITACTGDLIACCDQDDVWLPHKLATLAERFDRQPDLGFASSDADAIDADDRPLGYRLWDSVGFTPRLRRRFAHDPFGVLVRQNVVTGATLMFAARLRPLVLPVPPGWMHDGWIALLAAAIAPTVAVPDRLVQYRQHAHQSIGAERPSLRRQMRTARTMGRTVFAEHASAYAAALVRLSDWPGVPDRPVRLLGEKVAHCRTRSAIRLRQRHRLSASLAELVSLRYQRFSLGWKSFAQDLFL
jgi:hypothetical protein